MPLGISWPITQDGNAHKLCSLQVHYVGIVQQLNTVCPTLLLDFQLAEIIVSLLRNATYQISEKIEIFQWLNAPGNDHNFSPISLGTIHKPRLYLSLPGGGAESRRRPEVLPSLRGPACGGDRVRPARGGLRAHGLRPDRGAAVPGAGECRVAGSNLGVNGAIADGTRFWFVGFVCSTLNS